MLSGRYIEFAGRFKIKNWRNPGGCIFCLQEKGFFILFSFILPQSFFPDTEFSLDHTSEFFGPLSNKKQSKCPLPLLCPFSFALSCFHRNTSVFCSISSRLCYLNTHIHTLTHTRECQLYSLIEHLPISSAFTHFTFHPIFLIITLLRIAEL